MTPPLVPSLALHTRSSLTDDSPQSRIQRFNWIRDIPYNISLTANYGDYCCSSKAEMLQILLGAVEIESRKLVCFFNWSALGLPEEILKLAPNDREEHTFLEVLIPETNKWEQVDPTWNYQLAALGFAIPQWDGLSSTALAVSTDEILSAEASEHYITEYDASCSTSSTSFLYSRQETKFFKKLNKWCRSAPERAAPTLNH